MRAAQEAVLSRTRCSINNYVSLWFTSSADACRYIQLRACISIFTIPTVGTFAILNGWIWNVRAVRSGKVREKTLPHWIWLESVFVLIGGGEQNNNLVPVILWIRSDSFSRKMLPTDRLGYRGRWEEGRLSKTEGSHRNVTGAASKLTQTSPLDSAWTKYRNLI